MNRHEKFMRRLDAVLQKPGRSKRLDARANPGKGEARAENVRLPCKGKAAVWLVKSVFYLTWSPLKGVR